MVETILHLFKIHREVVFGNSPIIVQDMLRVTPKSFNAVDMILAAVGKGLSMIQTVVLAQPFKGVVASEGVGVVHRALPGMLLDVRHKLLGRYPLHNLGVYLAVAFQKAQNNAFPSRTSSPLTLAPAAKIGVVNLNLTLKLAGFKLRDMVDRLAQVLVDTGNRLVINSEVGSHAIRRLLLVKSRDHSNLSAQPLERFLFSTRLVSAAHVSAPRPGNLERTTEHALSASQKVGRTGENVLLSSNHKGILAPRGYETH